MSDGQLLRNRYRDQLIVVFVTLVTGTLTTMLFLVPRYSQAYDTGVYLAATLRFTSGVMPYHSFYFVQPPGIMLILSPVAVVAHLVSTHAAVQTVRALSGVVVSLNAGLLAWLVRSRGPVAMLIGGLALAVAPVSIYVDASLELEPYCLFFVLVAVWWILERGELHGYPRRVVIWSGLWFSLALTIKLFAILPLVAMLIILAVVARRRVLWFVGAVSAGWTVLNGWFIVGDPSAFLRDIFLAQLHRHKIAADFGIDITIWQRLAGMLGYLDTKIASTKQYILIDVIVVAVVVLLGWRRWQTMKVGDWFWLLATAMSSVGFLVGAWVSTYNFYFIQPFFAALVAVSIAGIGRTLSEAWRERIPTANFRRSIIALAVGALLIVTGNTLWNDFRQYQKVEFLYGFAQVNQKYIPIDIAKGSCVLYDVVLVGLDENRWWTRDPSCAKEIDAYGSYLANNETDSPALLDHWQKQMLHAQYVVMTGKRSSVLPWSRSQGAWFLQHFHGDVVSGTWYIYQRDARYGAG